MGFEPLHRLDQCFQRAPTTGGYFPDNQLKLDAKLIHEIYSLELSTHT